jgi:hypothetical protein
MLEDGTRIFDFHELKTIAGAHYGSLFTKKDDVALETLASILENIPMVVSNKENK